MKLKIKAKAFIGCLMASLLFSTPLLAMGFQLSLVDVSDVDKESLKAYVEKILDIDANNSILFSEVDLLMHKEMFYVAMVKNCTKAVCNYDKDTVDDVLDKNTDRAIKDVYAHQLKKGATEDDLAAWVEKNIYAKGCDYLNILKDSFKNIKVVTEGHTRIFMMDINDDSKVKITFDSAGEILGVKYNEFDAHHKYDVEYIFTSSATVIKASESTFCEGLSDSTEGKSVHDGMVTNFEVTVTIDHDSNVIKKEGKIYVYNKLLSCCDHKFKLKDDTLSSAANGDYVSIDELLDDGIVQNLSLNPVDARSAAFTTTVASMRDSKPQVGFVKIEGSQLKGWGVKKLTL
ncbi:MAG: hypothetical protein QS721_09860 [Candidatus Endonucleobacter sp. (ex Gigantidas childressi)]|nr:hypothetical protein [Candidatus Endonucleobacter sp. (ex Gigantidas childressi)]